MEQTIDFREAAENPFVQRFRFAPTNLTGHEPAAGGEILIAAGFGLPVPERLVLQPDGGQLGDLLETDDDMAEIGDGRMSIIKIELIPELFRGMPVDPADALFNGIRRPTIACERIGGLFRRHRSDGDDPATGLILTHSTRPILL